MGGQGALGLSLAGLIRGPRDPAKIRILQIRVSGMPLVLGRRRILVFMWSLRPLP